MRIKSVEAIPVSYPEPNDDNAIRHLCLVKIMADDGQVGWGESITQFPESTWSTKVMIDGMSEWVVDRDPVQNKVIVESLKDRAWYYGYGGGIASYAISAIDIALWDLKGKALGVSVLDLLGGAVWDRLPVIASGLASHPTIGQLADEVSGWMEQGFQGLKTGFGTKGEANLGYEHDRDVEYVRTMRDVIGPERSLMVDYGKAVELDLPAAVKRTQAFDEYNLTWVEEPLGAWDPEGYRTLRDKVNAAIAFGEREWTIEGFERVLSTGTVDVVGVDPGRSEGITGFVRVAQRCEFYRRQANAHAWSSAIVTAASLAVSFSSRACKLFEFKPLRNPMQDDLVAEPFRHHEGWVYPPSGPGLGIEVLDDVVEHFRSGESMAE